MWSFLVNLLWHHIHVITAWGWFPVLCIASLIPQAHRNALRDKPFQYMEEIIQRNPHDIMVSMLYERFMRPLRRVTPPDEQTEDPLKRELELRVEQLKQRMHITTSIRCEIAGHVDGCATVGMDPTSHKRVRLSFDRSLYRFFEEDIVEFILAHELAHVKCDDHRTMQDSSQYVAIAITLVCAYLFPNSAPPLSDLTVFHLCGWFFFGIPTGIACLLGWIACTITFYWVSKRREAAADSLACQTLLGTPHSQGGIKLMQHFIDSAIATRQQAWTERRWWTVWTTSQHGNDLSDWKHPLVTTRLANMQNYVAQNQ